LGWIYDLVQFNALYPDFDWGQALEHADQLKGKRMLLQGMFLAHDIFLMSLPAVVRRELEAQPNIQQVSEQLETQIISFPIKRIAVKDFVLQFSIRQGWRDRFFYVLANAKPNENETGWISRTHLKPMMYLVRAYRLFKRYVIPSFTSKHTP
jgi:hypothetical protein